MFKIHLFLGCVTNTGEHVGISNYHHISNQWTQCRRFHDGCRLINVTNDCNYF